MSAKSQTFDSDVDLVADGVVLKSGERKVLVSPRLQGTVCVSTCDGESIGYLNREAVRSGMGGIGGAERFWFAPDGSQYTVFFEPGVPLEEENWRVPPEVASGEMRVLEQTDHKIVMEREIRLANHLGTQFKTRLKRTVLLLPKRSEYASVAFHVENQVTNLGERWVADKGLLSVWSLSTFQGGDDVEVIVPLSEKAEVRKYFQPFKEGQLRR